MSQSGIGQATRTTNQQGDRKPFRLASLPSKLQDRVFAQIAHDTTRETFGRLRLVSKRFTTRIELAFASGAIQDLFPVLVPVGVAQDAKAQDEDHWIPERIRAMWVKNQLQTRPNQGTEPIHCDLLSILNSCIDTAYVPYCLDNNITRESIEQTLCELLSRRLIGCEAGLCPLAEEQQLVLPDENGIKDILLIIAAARGDASQVRAIMDSKSAGSYGLAFKDRLFPTRAFNAAAKYGRRGILELLWKRYYDFRCVEQVLPSPRAMSCYRRFDTQLTGNILWPTIDKETEAAVWAASEGRVAATSFLLRVIRQGTDMLMSLHANGLSLEPYNQHVAILHPALTRILEAAVMSGSLPVIQLVCNAFMDSTGEDSDETGCFGGPEIERPCNDQFSRANVVLGAPYSPLNRLYTPDTLFDSRQSLLKYGISKFRGQSYPSGDVCEPQAVNQMVLHFAAKHARPDIIIWALSNGASPYASLDGSLPKTSSLMIDNEESQCLPISFALARGDRRAFWLLVEAIDKVFRFRPRPITLGRARRIREAEERGIENGLPLAIQKGYYDAVADALRLIPHTNMAKVLYKEALKRGGAAFLKAYQESSYVVPRNEHSSLRPR